MKIIHIGQLAGIFAEDKDIAKDIRETRIDPEISKRRGRIELDFEGVAGATQSFVHALVSQTIREHGPSAIERIHFKNCVPLVRAVIEIVVDYSQLGLYDDAE